MVAKPDRYKHLNVFQRTNNFMLSSGVAQIHGQVQDTRRNPGNDRGISMAAYCYVNN
jgi:hypothetical protein